MSRALKWCAAALAAAILVAPTAARADLSFGYDARYVALGGAGLALVDNPGQTAQINPAMLSLRSGGFSLQWPSMGLRVRGAGIGKAFDHLASGSISSGDALDLARALGEQPTRIEANLGLGLSVSSFDLRARSQANVLINPGTAFTQWARSGQEFDQWVAGPGGVLPQLTTATTAAELDAAIANLGLSADVLGAATIAPSIAMGARVPNSLLGNRNVGDIHVGVRVKPTRVYYSHWVVRPTLAAGANLTDGLQANELTVQTLRATELGTRDSLSETSLAADLGLVWQPAAIPYTTFAFTVDNLIEPSFRLPSSPGVPRGGERIMPRTMSVGAALQVPVGLALAADLMDITGANGDMQFRAGGEFRPPVPGLRWIALRAGYNSGTGLTAGLGLGGFGIAYASRTPVVASQTFNF